MAENQNPYFIPISIVLAGLLIAGAVFYSSQKSQKLPSEREKFLPAQVGESLGQELAQKIKPVTEQDHIRGNPQAPVTLIEYSDIQCPFCARFHPTLVQVLAAFPGQVRWVWRHFPLTSIHPEAFGSAVASECAAELGGNEAFWQFIDEAFKNQTQLGLKLYRQIAEKLKLDLEAFDSCLGAERYKIKVSQQLKEAIDSGGRGTPYNIVIAANGQLIPFSGALPFETVKKIIEQALTLK